MLQATDIRGIVPPITTPLTENDAVDREGVARLIDWFIDAGCVGIFAIGSSGEGPSLTREMRYEMVDACADALGGRIPLLAGVSSPSYKESVMQAEQVAEIGADAIVATCPYYFFYGQSQLRDYFEALTEASPLPLVIYDIPARSDNQLEVHTVLELADNERIIGIKDSTGNIERGVNIVNALEGRDDFTIMQGSEQMLGMAALMGYHGAVMGMANACPKLFVALLEAGKAGDVEKTRELQKTVNNAFPYFFAAEPGTRNVGTIVGAMKTAQELQGLISRRLLFPARQVTDEDVSRIKVFLDPLAEAGWIEYAR
ncbi:MAG: dihydrodipicolinate synthase family protein [Armatimonadota bacterium]